MKWLTEDGSWRTRYIPKKKEFILEYYLGEGGERDWVFSTRYLVPLSWKFDYIFYGAHILTHFIGVHPDSVIRVEEEDDDEWEVNACRKPDYWP